MVGLSDQVQLRQGSALAIPFEDNSFDVGWTEHVQMNIADKHKFYSEICRVLKPGGRLLFHDIFRGMGEPPIYPAPWAEDESISSLATHDEARTAIQTAGLNIEQWVVKDEASLEFFKAVLRRIQADGLPLIGIHLLMGDTARDKIDNYTRNLEEERFSVALGLAHNKG